MTARIRIAVAVAILFALAAHPALHPLAKECPCVHHVAASASAPACEVVLPQRAERPAAAAAPVIESDAAKLLPPRAPPSA